jgi:hypothetical protein
MPTEPTLPKSFLDQIEDKNKDKNESQENNQK